MQLETFAFLVYADCLATIALEKGIYQLLLRAKGIWLLLVVGILTVTSDGKVTNLVTHLPVCASLSHHL